MRHDFASTGFRFCRKCGAPCTPARQRAKDCPGWPVKAHNAPKRKQPGRHKTKGYHKSRFKRGETVWLPKLGKFGKVEGHRKRKRALEGAIQWRETPLVRVEGAGQAETDDNDLRDVEGRPRT